MHAKHVLYVRTLIRMLQAGIENINPLIKNLFRFLWKNLCSFLWVSTVVHQFVSRSLLAIPSFRVAPSSTTAWTLAFVQYSHAQFRAFLTYCSVEAHFKEFSKTLLC